MTVSHQSFREPGRWKRQVSAILLLAALGGPIRAQEEGQPLLEYEAPKLDRRLFEKTAVVPGLEGALLGLALFPETPVEVRTKAIVLAFSANPNSADIAITDFNLRNRTRIPTSQALPPYTGLSEACSDLHRIAETALKYRASTPDFYPEELASGLLEILGEISTDDSAESDFVSENLSNLKKPDWSLSESAEESTTPRSIISTTVSDKTFGGKQSRLNGLLVVELEGNQYAGSASLMNATAVPAPKDPTRPSEIRFNQGVGNSMMSALKEVQKFIALRHSGIPSGHTIEIAFEEHYSGKDGPSAAVACGLLIDSLITGDPLDDKFAVTGDMNADGAVRPVGGIDGKIRGASKRNCTHVAIPSINQDTLSDLLVLEDLEPLHKIQIFTIESFDEAKALALAPEKREAKIAKSLELFATVQGVLNRNGAGMLANKQVQDRLREVIDLTPNHASARLLLLRGQGQTPEKLTLGGSLINIDRAALPVLEVIKSNTVDNRASQLTDAIFALQRIRRKLDPRTQKCADSLSDLSDALREYAASTASVGSLRSQQIRAKVGEALDRVDSEYESLRNRPDVREELEK